MNSLQEIAASFRLVILGETTCRLFFVSSPIIWIFGCFFLGVSAITIYCRFDCSGFTVYMIVFGLFMLICGVFSASNTIHVCIQLPTSPVALKIQKIGQVVILVIYLIMIFVGYALSWSVGGLVMEKSVKDALIGEFDSLFYNELTFLALFVVTTFSCLLS